MLTLDTGEKKKMKCRKCIVTISLSVTIMALITMSAMAIDTGLREIDKNKASSDLSFSATQDYTSNAASAKVLTGTSIPEYPTVVIPLLMILGLFFYYRRKRQIDEWMRHKQLFSPFIHFFMARIWRNGI